MCRVYLIEILDTKPVRNGGGKEMEKKGNKKNNTMVNTTRLDISENIFTNE